ncbi:MAG: hypothetical protein U0836_22045 [Pirellulales bacterium]
MKNRGLVVLVIGAMALLALPLGLWLWVRLGTRAHLASRQLAELRAQGQPVALAELAGPPIAEADNAAAGLFALGPQLKTLEPATSAYLTGADQPGWPSAAQLAAAATALAGHDALFTELDEVSRRPAYQPAADYSKPPTAVSQEALDRAQDLRQAQRVLRMRVATQLAAGQTAEARQTCLTMLRLARHAQREPLLNGYLMARAVRFSALEALAESLAGMPPTDTERQQIAEELARHDPVGAWRHALATERVFGIASFDEIKQQGAGFLTNWLWDDDLSRYLTLIDQSMPDLRERLPVAPPASGASGRLGALTNQVESSIQRAAEAVRHDIAALRAARILVALAGRSPQAGPPTAAELGLPPELLADPFAQGRLVIKPAPAGGWLVYSVGPNGQDDGGNPQRDIILELKP